MCNTDTLTTVDGASDGMVGRCAARRWAASQCAQIGDLAAAGAAIAPIGDVPVGDFFQVFASYWYRIAAGSRRIDQDMGSVTCLAPVSVPGELLARLFQIAFESSSSLRQCCVAKVALRQQCRTPDREFRPRDWPAGKRAYVAVIV